MDDLRIATRLHICVVDIVRRLREEVTYAATTIVNHIPFPWQIQHVPFAVRVEHVLVVVDEIGIRGVGKPLFDGVMLTHRLGVEHQHAGLEVIVWILHLQHGLRVAHAFAVLHVEIGEEVDVSNRAEHLALQIDVVKLRDIAVDDDVGIEIQHLVVERQNLLNQEAVIRLHTDMGVIGGKIVASKFAVHVGEPQIHIRELLEEATQTFLLVPCDVALQHRHIVEVMRIGVLHG